MAKRRILVVDDSPAMRETLCVLLGNAFDVRAASTAELASRGAAWAACDLVIAGVALRGSPTLPASPVLWLGGEAGEDLPRRFTPTELRRRVADRLANPRPGEPSGLPARRWWLDEPFLDAAARAVIERARKTGLALHIAGEPGSGKHAVARALHGEGPFLVCDAAHPLPADLRALAATPATPATLLAIGVDRWPEGSQRALAVELSSETAPHLRVISTATRDLAELRDAGGFLPDLYYRLTLFTVHLRPLRDRPADIPAIAAALAADVAARLGRRTPTFSPAAVERLSNYLWFGNIAELQAVLTRSLALAGGDHLDVADLRFDGATLAAPPPARGGDESAAESAAGASHDSAEQPRSAAPAAQPAAPAAATPAPIENESEPRQSAAEPRAAAAAAPREQAATETGAAAPQETAGAATDGEAHGSADDGPGNNLDMIIHELAHEFKNPLVAIKSFTQHCQRSLPDADEDEVRFAEMTERAAEQMDQVLENLLTFTRMTEPQPQVVALDRLLAPLFANGSGAAVDYIAPPPVRVRVDPEQVSYAIDNLLRALLRDAPPGRQMTAQFCAPDALLCQLPAGPATAREKLRELVSDGDAGGGDDKNQAEAMPLGIALASALLERNGAELRMTREGDPKTVMIRFPLVESEDEEVEARNGTSPRIGG